MMESAMPIHTHCPAPSTISLLITVLLWNFGHACLPLLLLFLLISPATAQHQYAMPPPPDPFAKLQFDKTMAIVLVILIMLFFILGFVSIFTRQCAERRVLARLNLSIPIIGVNDNSRRTPRGLDQEIIDKFPTFVYSAVKTLKIGMATLECAVCLNEFLGDETLRLIPNCSHVFHPDCIDVWLTTHSTCPVCRADLVPKPGVAIQIPDPRDSDSEEETNDIALVNDDDRNLDEQNSPVRTGFNIGNLFPRSHSTGHSLVGPGKDRERFTLRLPEEVRNELVNNSGSTLSRTKSCGVMLQRESSWRRGYRTRSYRHYERFGGESRLDRWGFMWTPPFVGRTGSTRLAKETKKTSVAMNE